MATRTKKRARRAARKPRVAPMRPDELKLFRAAIRQGQNGAVKVLRDRRRFHGELKGRRASLMGAGPAQPAGVLIAEGDSWFNYPFCDVLQELKHVHGFEVHSAAHAGDTVESMAYDLSQYAGLVDKFMELSEAGTQPSAILLSGGGNDIAGSVLTSLLNYKDSPNPGLNDAVVTGVFNDRLRPALARLISTVTALYRAHFAGTPKIVIHGYDYPVPDGRGYMGGLGPLPGPWLQPQFRSRGYTELATTTGLMQSLIDRFNDMARSVAAAPGMQNVRYLDLRGTLTNKLQGSAYKKTWANELHPTRPGFADVAQKFSDALARSGA